MFCTGWFSGADTSAGSAGSAGARKVVVLALVGTAPAKAGAINKHCTCGRAKNISVH